MSTFFPLSDRTYRNQYMESKNFLENELDELLVTYVIGSCTDEERKHVESWLSEKHENRHYFEQLKDIYSLGKTLKAPSGFDQDKSLQRIKMEYYKFRYNERNSDNKQAARKINSRTLIAIAASLLLLVSLGINIISLSKRENNVYADIEGMFNEVSSPLGSRTRVILPDSTLVWLNAGSKMKYPMDFMRGDRRIALTGEAYFEVKKNPGKKFIVNTSDISIHVLGTKFNVKAYPDEETIKTTLVEGSISILNLKGNRKDKETLLNPNQTAIYYKEAKTEAVSEDTKIETIKSLAQQHAVQIENEINTVLYTSWKDNKWVIEGMNLGDLSRELERRYNVNIRFMDESIRTYRFNGIIANENIEQILEIIKVSAPVHYSINNNQIRLEYNEDSKSKYDEYLRR